MPKTQADETIRLPIIPLRSIVLFPGVVQSIDIGRPRSLAVAAAAAAGESSHIALVPQRDASVEDPGRDDLFDLGVEAEVVRVLQVQEGQRATMVVRGLRRVRLLDLDRPEGGGPMTGAFLPLQEVGASSVEAQGLMLSVRDLAKQLISESSEISDEAAATLDHVRDAGALADLAASLLDLEVADKMELLGILDVPARLRGVLERLQRAIAAHKVKENIDSHVRAEMGRHQREAMLRQRLRAIQEQLGDTDEEDVAGEFEERVAAAKMPPEVEQVAHKQIARLRQIPVQSPEHTVARTYLEWLVELPWSRATEDELDLARAREILDADHYGMEKVKKRIIEYLAVRKLNPDKKSPILCLVGPPGVGKTSTGRSVARALGREFVRASLGGVRDEAEIRGHRRTYVGALPGRIIQSIRRAGTKNPVFVLDEIDKLGSDFRGDPSSALLEVLDPEQNKEFSDHFLEVPFDLSQVLFFATANEVDPIPPALKDRLEILEIPGYTRNEKLLIARRHLIPRQIEEHGLDPERVSITDEAVMKVIDAYTREAGVRNLEREIASICRSLAVRVARGEETLPEVTADALFDILGPERYYPEVAERTQIPGVATGLAWTPVGGEIMFVEATRMPGKGKLILTGQLGGVMQESAQAALTFARSRAAQLGLDPDFFARSDLHIHFPAGAVKKDGPSAGLTMITALVSLLSGSRVRADIAMTGEISLRGTVMPVGGIKEKVLAAHRAGIKRVILPARNRKDVVDIPEDVRDEIELIFVSRVEEAMAIALDPPLKSLRTPSKSSVPVPDAAQSPAAL